LVYAVKSSTGRLKSSWAHLITPCTFSRSGWSVVRNASLAEGGTSKKRPSPHLHKVPTRSNKVSPRIFQTIPVFLFHTFQHFQRRMLHVCVSKNKTIRNDEFRMMNKVAKSYLMSLSEQLLERTQNYRINRPIIEPRTSQI
jgi:hypothetical protein